MQVPQHSYQVNRPRQIGLHYQETNLGIQDHATQTVHSAWHVSALQLRCARFTWIMWLCSQRLLTNKLTIWKKIFRRLKQAGLKLKPSKWHLFEHSVKLLGHVISEKGIQTAADKVDAIKNWPVPRNLTELCSFIDLCSYYCRFIEDFSKIAGPLYASWPSENGQAGGENGSNWESFQKMSTKFHATSEQLKEQVAWAHSEQRKQQLWLCGLIQAQNQNSDRKFSHIVLYKQESWKESEQDRQNLL